MRFKVYFIQGIFAGEMTLEGITELFRTVPSVCLSVHGGPEGNEISGETDKFGWNDYLLSITSR